MAFFFWGLRKLNDTSRKRKCLFQADWFVVNEESFPALQGQVGCPWSASPSEQRGILTDSCCTFIFEREVVPKTILSLFTSTSISALNMLPQSSWIFWFYFCENALWSNSEASGTCCLQPTEIAEDADFSVLQVLRKSTEPPCALAVCISLLNIISAVIKWSGH